MTSNPNLILSDTFQALDELLERLSGELDADARRRALWHGIIGPYEGSDIIEVVCREAAYITVYDRFKQHAAGPRANYKRYLREVLKAARKYAASVDWPPEEKSRAEAFARSVRQL